MPVRKNPTKTGNKSVLEELPVGYFKLEGRIVRAREAFSWEVRNPANTPRRQRPMRRTEKRLASVRFQTENLSPDIFLNIPLEVFNQMQLGKSYEIQCTIIEKKGNNEDA